MQGSMKKVCPHETSCWTFKDHTYKIIDLPKIFGRSLERLPYVIRIISENALRHTSVNNISAMVEAITSWQTTESKREEISIIPQRILMHDTTCGPAIVDIAAMRDEVKLAGGNPAALNPIIPIDISTDHSLSVEYYGQSDAASKNIKAEFIHNSERYRLMKWAGNTMNGLSIYPPGTGIMHTINLEQLATIATTAFIDDAVWAVPDILIGTDSHTPMVNGIGVLGWGVGGIEAEAAMFGLPVTMQMPRVIGVSLKGELIAGTLATDVALTITQILRQYHLDNAFVEFCGSGISNLSAATRATVANMAPEFGGTSGYFPIDAISLQYLRDTGRTEAHISFVEAYAKRTGLWFDPTKTPNFTEVIEIDLSRIRPSLSGPKRPQDRIDISRTKFAMSEASNKQTASIGSKPIWPVAIAAITSCTNTSDLRALITAGLVAKNAVSFGLRVPSWVKTSLAPGSPSAASALERAGLLKPLSKLGFDIVGYGCTTCIGQSGPLAPEMESLLEKGETVPVAVLSGNRNFPGRVHPKIDNAFLGSPALVVAFALAGDVDRDISNEPIGNNGSGKPVYLSDIWPDDYSIATLTQAANRPDDYAAVFAKACEINQWENLAAPRTSTYDWDIRSTFLQPPPFCQRTKSRQLIDVAATPLLVLGDDITTDHISPAGQIPPNSEAGRYLIECGDKPDALGVYAARRGNWQVMRRGLFTNPSLVNLLDRNLAPGKAIEPHTGEVMPLWRLAETTQTRDQTFAIFAGERYGMGSSRDWAAKGQYLIGVSIVFASSFERIHRANLVGMGIVPLRLGQSDHPTSLDLTSNDRVAIKIDLHTLTPDQQTVASIIRDGLVRRKLTVTVEVKTSAEISQLRAGGILPMILEQSCAS